MLKTVTLTGLDERTNIADIVALQHQYPFLEFGILLSRNLSGTGKNNRYPHTFLLEELHDKGLNLSCHLCGSIARDVILKANWEPFYDMVGSYANMFRRIQLNVANLTSFAADVEFPSQFDCIVQIKYPNTELYSTYKHLPNVYGFHDNSGGRGTYTNDWMSPSDSKLFGYAGGISFDNIEATLDSIRSVNYNDFWIDMESSIRTDDWLDITKCKHIADVSSRYIDTIR